MSDPKYIIMDFRHCLAHAIEECGEFLAAAGKCARWGKYSYNPEPGASRETNVKWLLREMQDAEEALARLRSVLAKSGDCGD